MQYQKLQIYQFGPASIKKVITVTPAVFRDVGNQVGGGEVVRSPWLSTVNTGIQHLTFVDWMSRYNSTGDSTHTVETQFRVWLDFRGTR